MKPFKLDLFMQRLTDEELRLIREFPHELDRPTFEKRAAIIQREQQMDYRWGFFDIGIHAWFKRLFYRAFVHRKLKRQPSVVPYDYLT